MLWRRSNGEVVGIMVAGNCILCIAVSGFGFLLVGTFLMIASTSFDPKLSDSSLVRNQTNVPRIIGTVLLSIGATIFVVGLVLLFIIIRKAKGGAGNYQVPVPTETTHPGPNYTTMQSYSSTGQAQTQSTQPTAQFQSNSTNVGQGQLYPPVTGQVQPYQPVISEQEQPYQPVKSGQEQPYLPGPGQTCPPTSDLDRDNLIYTPVAEPGESYPPVPEEGKSYQASGGVRKHYRTGRIAEMANFFNPGYPQSLYPRSDLRMLRLRIRNVDHEQWQLTLCSDIQSFRM